MKFVIFEMWGLERATNVPKWIPWNSWCMKVLSSEGFAHGKVVGAPRHNLIGWWGVLWKSEIRGFWDVRVGKAYKFPQMKTIKFLVHESFEFGGVCTWQACRCTTAQLDWLVGSFVKKWNSWFLRCEGWKGLQISPNEHHEILGARKFWIRRGLHMASLSVHHGITWLVGGEFCEKWNSWFLRCEGWKGLKMSPNEDH